MDGEAAGSAAASAAFSAAAAAARFPLPDQPEKGTRFMALALEVEAQLAVPAVSPVDIRARVGP